MLSRSIGQYYEFEELFESGVLNNLERIRLEAKDINIDYYSDYLWNQDLIKSRKKGDIIVRKFIQDFFNYKYDIAYQDFLNKANNDQELVFNEENADGYVAGIVHKRRVLEVMLPPMETFNNVTVYPHEFAHYLNFKYNPKMFDDYLLRELPAILLQSIFVDFVDKNNYFRKVFDVNYLFTF